MSTSRAGRQVGRLLATRLIDREPLTTLVTFGELTKRTEIRANG